jgi:hypothetical protein
MLVWMFLMYILLDIHKKPIETQDQEESKDAEESKDCVHEFIRIYFQNQRDRDYYIKCQKCWKVFNQ